MKVLRATNGFKTAMSATETVGQLAEHNPIDLTMVTVPHDPNRSQFQPWGPEWTVHFHHTQSYCPIASHFGEAIVQQAESIGATSILVGDTGHGLSGKLFLGSTCKYVLRHAPCSVWISRHHNKTSDDAIAEVADADAAN